MKTNIMKIFLSILLIIPTSSSESKDDTYAHLQNPTIREICSVKDRATICASSNTNVCTARKSKGRMEYRDYENNCYLFLSNMCEHPGSEFHIAGSGLCGLRLARQTNKTDVARRQISNVTHGKDVGDVTETENGTEDPPETVTLASDEADGPNTQGEEAATETFAPENVKRPIERLRMVTPSARYNVSEAYDGHNCPGHCTEEYQPVCLIANRGFGMYFKYLTFLNHCQADMYYCSHVAEFAPPPDESEEMISGSKLDWSFCASYRFLQFARFSEVASSMGHYGWLLGDQKYSHILNPVQKLKLSGLPRPVHG